jgi:hypothetical protein
MEYRWTNRDMAEFEKQHPAAYSFLLHRSLLNEYRNLATNEIILNEWQKNRMKELEELCGFVWDDVTKANVADLFYDQRTS